MFGGIEPAEGSNVGADAFVEGLEFFERIGSEVLSGAKLSGFVGDAAFDFVDAFEVLLEFVSVFLAEGFFEALGVIENDVEDGLVAATCLGIVTEEPVEGDAGVVGGEKGCSKLTV